ncbi:MULTISPECIES: sulfurtransferase [Grimontia]|uniref:3-mercaptopyruvate sulfurtransferase n=1 Tax=Grimontia marina TaxID=646534 RepID=A0A128FD87_9GAMM|nr:MULTISPECIES: sulfurtransferase [Grimontia]WRV99994.1 sulfurtransferase [Grimontia sp. NTOU-MAR1]CZF84251.1 3-mercaptopyruvate sulfurtransferase [Grimontia marina]
MLQINEVLVSAEWLRDNLDSPKLKLVDASWFMPGTDRNAKSEWSTKRIPGSVYFDFDGEIYDKTSPLPHMLPSEAQFEAAVAELGISNEDDIVVYDTAGIFSSPRVWWMFKVMGHQNVALLDGGMPAWEGIGGELDTDVPQSPTSTGYKAKLDKEGVINSKDLLAGIEAESLNVVDVRPADRFSGCVAEPRPGVRSGHMPTAKNLPFLSLTENGKFKSKETLSMLLSQVLSKDKPNVSSCGSGVTACTFALAAEWALGTKIAVYDGSWTEWGSNTELPVVKD